MMAHPETLAAFFGCPPPESVPCGDCGDTLFLQVWESGAGWATNARFYLGYKCENCGPISRETEYLTQNIAIDMLATKENPCWNVYWR